MNVDWVCSECGSKNVILWKAHKWISAINDWRSAHDTLICCEDCGASSAMFVPSEEEKGNGK